MIFMSLCIGTELKLTMAAKVKGAPNNDCSWAESRRDSMCSWKAVQPKITGVDHFYHEPGWETVERQGVIDASSPLFHSTDVTFHGGDMLVVGNDIQSDVQSGKVGLKRNKLIVHKEVGDLETTL